MDIQIPLICPILDIVLGHVRGQYPLRSPSIDRIDNSKGYIKGNIAVISTKANKLKGDMTLCQIKALYDYVST